jgi:hypothetical protein
MLNKESILNFLQEAYKDKEFKKKGIKSILIEKNGYEEGSISIMSGGYIRFFGRLGYTSPGGYIHCSNYLFDLFSDFAEKDLSAQQSSGNKFGRYVSCDEFFDLLKIHMPAHFEWCLWNLV